MKKILILILALSMVLIAACSNEKSNVNSKEGSDTTKSEEPKKAEINSLDDVVSYFESKGYEIGDKEDKYFAMIGAKNGFGIHLNSKDVELYQFAEGVESEYLDSAKENNTISIADQDEPAYLNGNVLLVPIDDQVDDIVKDFNEM